MRKTISSEECEAIKFQVATYTDYIKRLQFLFKIAKRLKHIKLMKSIAKVSLNCKRDLESFMSSIEKVQA